MTLEFYMFFLYQKQTEKQVLPCLCLLKEKKKKEKTFPLDVDVK